MNTVKVLVVKDELGELRPMAGIWKDNEAGASSAEQYLGKRGHEQDSVVKATLTETE
jgi:DNA-binding LacI/PurR family transcriptional regulator